MRTRIAVAALVVAAVVSSLGASRATAGVNVGLTLVAPPQLVIVPGTPVAYAPAIPANYFFYNSQYYVFTNGGWFVASGFNGPWVAVPPVWVPAPLLAVPVRYYRAAPVGWQHWHRAQPPRWANVWGPQWSDRGPHARDHIHN